MRQSTNSPHNGVGAQRVHTGEGHRNRDDDPAPRALHGHERFLADLTYALTTETQELDALFQVTAERLVQVLGNACKIDVLDGDRDLLHMAAFAHRDPAAVELMRRLESTSPMTRHEGLLAETLRGAASQRITDVGAFDAQTARRVLKSEWHEYYTRFPIRSALSVPLLARGVLVGSIIVARDHVEPFTDEDTSLVEEVAARLAPFIANVRLNEERDRNAAEARENADRVERLQAITDTLVGAFRVDELIERIRDEFELDAARLLEIDDAGTALRGIVEIGFDGIDLPPVIRVGEGFAGEVAATRSARAVAAPFEGILPLFRKALREQRFHAFAGVPLLAGDDLVGVLVGGRRKPFAERDIDMLGLAASRIALALAHERAERTIDGIAERNAFIADIALEVARAPRRTEMMLAPVATRIAARLGAQCRIELAGDGGRVREVAFAPGPDPGADGRDEVAIPLPYHGTVLGTLSLARAADEPCPDADVALLEDIAARIAPWIAAVTLFEERGAMLQALEASERRYRRVVEHAPDVIYRYRCNDEPGFEFVSPSAAHILGYEPRDFYDDPRLLVSMTDPRYRDDLENAHRCTLALAAPIIAPFTRADGSTIWGEVRVTYIRDVEGNPIAVEGILRDVSDVHDAQDELAYRAMHDPLTQLPNRHLLSDRLELALSRQARTGVPVTIVFIDLDRFKVVNDSLGHAAGDEMLASVADRLRASVRPSDTIARMGGDEFAILLDDTGDETVPIRVAQRVQQMLNAAIDVLGRNVHATVSMGIASTAPGTDVLDRPADLMRHADAALYLAKERGRDRFEVFDEQMRTSLHERLRTESELHDAIDLGQLEVFYQPQLHLGTERVLHAEALVRWHHPTRGTLAAAEFIAIAEDAGLVVPMGLLVLDQACRQHVAWRDRYGDRAPSIAVNLSDRQLAQPHIVDDLRVVLERTGVDPDDIWLEITESSLIDIDRSARALRDVRELGVHLAIDDFGTRYSSLSYLRRYPIEALKIDRSFVDDLTRDPDVDAIVAAIVTLGKTLGLSVIAEGVEDAHQLAHLADLGVDFAQGYLIGRPAPARDFACSVLDAADPA